VLPEANRLRSSAIFTAVTKSGYKVSSQNLVIYGLKNKDEVKKINPVQFGLIINRSIGGAVKRHKIARKIRHDLMNFLNNFPSNTFIVIRVLKQNESYGREISNLVTKLQNKLLVNT
jgi:ribonuclease P protein component